MRNDEAESRLQKDAVERLEGKGWVLKVKEYHVVPPYDQMGKGDLMFFRRDGERIALGGVQAHGPRLRKTARTKRTKARKKVKEQCLYMSPAPNSCTATFASSRSQTNESGIEVHCRFHTCATPKTIFERSFHSAKAQCSLLQQGRETPQTPQLLGWNNTFISR